ncbi:MAG: beta-ketoacyl-[acyl-carrier-protein] synthase family protein [Mycobacteriales bacterium]
MERVLVTGLGVVSCLGSDLDSYWTGLLGARSAPAPVDDPDANMKIRLLYGIGPMPPPSADGAGRPGRTSTFAVHAGTAALVDAGLPVEDGELAAGGPVRADRVGVAVGTGVGDCSLPERARQDGAQPDGLDAFPFKVGSVLAGRLGVGGPVVSVSTACSASAYSVSLGVDMIRDGRADVVLAGGADGYTRVGVACFNRLGALDPERCRPFDARRKGTIFGEGAAFLVLESESHARARGRDRYYGVVEGTGWSCDGHHATAPEAGARQIVRAMEAALAEAAVEPADIGCVVPHGTGTPLNDVVESRALHRALGAAAGTLPVYSLKALLGHTGGAAGAFALLTAMLMLDRGTVPPNVPLAEPDPDCAIRLPTGSPLHSEPRHILVNAYAFGGNNISVLVGRGER